MSNVGTVQVGVVPDMKTMGTGMSGWFSGVGSKLMLAAGATMGAKWAIGFGKDIIGSASNLNESINAIEVQYGAGADEVLRLGQAAASGMGLSNVEFNEHATSMGGFVKQIAGDSSEYGGTLDELMTRGGDFASVMNLDVGDAMAKFGSALAGEAEPMRKFGIDISAAAVNQFAYANGIAEVDSKLTDAQKVQARYGLLMQETTQFAGDFANTSDGLANRQRILGAEWENSKASLGEALLPAMEGFMGFIVDTVIPVLNDTLIPAFKGMAEWIMKNGDVVGPVVAVIAGAVAIFLAVAAAVKLWSAAQAILNIVLTANPIGLIILAIVAIIAILVVAYNKVDWFREFVDATFAWISKAFTTFVDFVTELWAEWGDEITAIATGAWDIIMAYFQYVWDLISGIFEAAFSFIQDMMDIWGDDSKSFWTKLWESILRVIEFAWDLIKTIFGAAFDFLANILSVFGVDLKGGVSDFMGAISDTFTTIWSNIKQVFSNVTSAISTVIRNFKATINIVVSAIRAVFQGFLNFFTSIFKGDFQGAFEALEGIVETVRDAIVDVISTWGGDILAKFKSGWTKVVTWFTSLPATAARWGGNIVSGIARGIRNSAGKVLSAIKSSITNNIPGWIKGPLGISSPSKLTMGYGAALAEGMALGITGGTADVEAATRALNAVALPVGADLSSAFGDITDGLGNLQVTQVFQGPVGGSMAEFADEIGRAAGLEARYAFA